MKMALNAEIVVADDGSVDASTQLKVANRCSVA
jgi:glycosyltransferase involved in cell wall biosynthesis